MKEGKREDFEFKDGLLFFQGLLNVLPSLAKLKVFQICYDFLDVEYFRVNKAIELVLQDYLWPQLWKFVKEYIQSYDIFFQIKGTCY